MTRDIEPSDLDELAELTRLKELAARGELVRLGSEISRLDEERSELASQHYSAVAPDDAAVVEKWQVWRNEHLSRLSIQMSAIKAEYREVARVCGRLSAENEVVQELRNRAKTHRARQAARRDSYTS